MAARFMIFVLIQVLAATAEDPEVTLCAPLLVMRQFHKLNVNGETVMRSTTTPLYNTNELYSVSACCGLHSLV